MTRPHWILRLMARTDGDVVLWWGCTAAAVLVLALAAAGKL